MKSEARYVVSPEGKVRRIHYIPNFSGFGAHAWVRAGFFRRIDQYAAGSHVVDNLIRRLKREGWKEQMVPYMTLKDRIIAWLLWKFEGYRDVDEAMYELTNPVMASSTRALSLMRARGYRLQAERYEKEAEDEQS